MKSIRNVLYLTVGLPPLGGDLFVTVGQAADVDAETV